MRELSNTDMVGIMARENMDLGHDAKTEIETVRAVLKAYGTKQIDLPDPGRITKSTRYARDKAGDSPRPGCNDVQVICREHPYTIETLATFLDWKPYKVEYALDILGQEDEGTLSVDTVAELSSRQAQEVANQIRRVLKTVTKTKGAEKAKAELYGMIRARSLIRRCSEREQRASDDGSTCPHHRPCLKLTPNHSPP